MTTETNDTAVVNADAPATGDIDAQLNSMREAEDGQTQEVTEPEVKAEPEQAEVKTKEERVVPLAALHEERNERKRLAAELQQQKALMERVNQRLEMLMTPRQQAPDPSQDPVGYIDHRLQGLEQTIKPVLQSQQDQQEAARRAAYENHLKNAVVASAQELSRSTPDLADAANYLNEMRARELMVLGVPEQQARVQATQEQDVALMTWAHQGMNAAQMAYEFAKARGYAPKAAQATVSAQEKIATQQKGVAASKGLGSGGSGGAGKLTAQALADMSDADFAKLTDEQFRQAMGG